MSDFPTPDFVRMVSTDIGIGVKQVRAAVQLLDEGNTIPFIARYRKEMTGELDETQLRDIAQRLEFVKNLHERKREVLRLLREQGVLENPEVGPTLVKLVQVAQSITEVDDIYRPYRPKRRTRASVARDRGLEPLAAWLKQADREADTIETIVAHAGSFLSEDLGVLTTDDAIQGALDIIAEAVADDAQTRKRVRTLTFERGTIRSVAAQPGTESVYEAYYDFAEPIGRTPPHRVLAMNRGEREGYLKVTLAAPDDDVIQMLIRHHVHDTQRSLNRKAAETSAVTRLLTGAVTDAYKRLIAPAVERELRSQLTDSAEEHAIAIFGQNLKQLLMQPPFRNKVVLGVDPAYRTGCKLAVVDETGKLIEVCVIYPTPPQNRVEPAKQEVLRLIRTYSVSLIAIGNGTASRETESFIAECVAEHRQCAGNTIPYLMVSEAGASVYSASILAGEEFPDLDVSERSAISIARRVQDPLAELVKIDPKSVGVGQYQHDVTQKKLDEQLAAVVETAVNQVGVDVNTASPSLLSYVAGLNRTVARNIVEFREQNGKIRNRKMLSKVPRLGPKTLEQCVGFLRVTDGDNLLDATPVHPESYPAVVRLLHRTGADEGVLANAATRTEWLRTIRMVPIDTLSQEASIGIPTLRDVLDALEQPGRDPREDVPPPILRTDVLKLEDMEVGMTLTGTVRNVVDFGAFVDVGVKNDGLVHISQLSNGYVKHPMDIVSVGDIVNVRVIQVDVHRQRLSLSMRQV